MKPVSVGAAWTQANAFIKREAGLLVPVMLFLVAMPLVLLLQAIPPEFRDVVPGAKTPPPVLPAGSQMIILLCLVVMMGGILSCGALALKPGIAVRDALRLGFRSLPAAFGAALLLGIAIGLPAVLIKAISPVAGDMVVIAGAMVASTRFLFLNAVIVDQRAGPIEALRKSWVLSRGQFSRLFLFIVVIAVPILLAQLVAELMLGLPATLLAGKDVGRQAGDFGASAALAMGQMVFVVMSSRLYRQIVPHS